MGLFVIVLYLSSHFPKALQILEQVRSKVVLTYARSIFQNIKTGKIRASVFSHSDLSAITFPKGITDIGEKAFEGCKYLKEVNLSEYDKLTIIRNGAFYGCIGLKEITFPKNLIVIGANAFSGCSSLQIVNLAEYDKLEKIGNGAFYDCDNLKEITFPKSITTLGEEFSLAVRK